MSIDTGSWLSALGLFLQNVFSNAPIGMKIVGIPTLIVIGLVFSYKVIGMIAHAMDVKMPRIGMGSGGRSAYSQSNKKNMRVGSADSLAGGSVNVVGTKAGEFDLTREYDLVNKAYDKNEWGELRANAHKKQSSEDFMRTTNEIVDRNRAGRERITDDFLRMNAHKKQSSEDFMRTTNEIVDRAKRRRGGHKS